MQNCKYGADLLEWTWCKDLSWLHLAPFYGLPQLMGNFRCYTSQINLHTGTHFWVNFLEILETEVWLPFPFIPRHFWSWRGTRYPGKPRVPGTPGNPEYQVPRVPAQEVVSQTSVPVPDLEKKSPLFLLTPGQVQGLTPLWAEEEEDIGYWSKLHSGWYTEFQILILSMALYIFRP